MLTTKITFDVSYTIDARTSSPIRYRPKLRPCRIWLLPSLWSVSFQTALPAEARTHPLGGDSPVVHPEFFPVHKQTTFRYAKLVRFECSRLIVRPLVLQFEISRSATAGTTFHIYFEVYIFVFCAFFLLLVFNLTLGVQHCLACNARYRSSADPTVAGPTAPSLLYEPSLHIPGVPTRLTLFLRFLGEVQFCFWKHRRRQTHVDGNC